MTSANSLRLVSPLRARMIEDMTVRGFNGKRSPTPTLRRMTAMG